MIHKVTVTLIISNCYLISFKNLLVLLDLSRCFYIYIQYCIQIFLLVHCPLTFYIHNQLLSQFVLRVYNMENNISVILGIRFFRCKFKCVVFYLIILPFIPGAASVCWILNCQQAHFILSWQSSSQSQHTIKFLSIIYNIINQTK